MGDAPTVITLTAIPPRFDRLAPTLRSLVNQELRAPVELWIPQSYQRYPDWDGALPAVPEGVTIRRCAQDWGPATKIVPALLERQGSAVDLLFCDDDVLYAPDWHRRLKALRQHHPVDALAAIGRHLPGVGGLPRNRADRNPRMTRLTRDVVRPLMQSPLRFEQPVPLVEQSGYADLLEGWGGVMVRPEFFAPELAQGPGPCWPVDDIWLSGMLELAGTAIWVEASILPPTWRRAGAIESLTLMTLEGQNRTLLDEGCIEALMQAHGIWTIDSLGLGD